MTAKKLDVIHLPLRDRHLIEASAGTGKTFNITRLYLRLLLEKKLSVEQILVMTFTNAATQEIRGRIAQTLREAKGIWNTLMQGDALPDLDPFYQALYARCPGEAYAALLDAALLELDEASVFTIHGFCNRVLSQLSFSTGAPMTLSLTTDNTAMYEVAVRDWLRRYSLDSDEFIQLSEHNWHDPDIFWRTFGAAIRSGLPPNVLSDEEIDSDSDVAFSQLNTLFLPKMRDVLDALFANQSVLFDALIETQKGDKRAIREQEWQSIVAWLESPEVTFPPKTVGQFYNGNRYRGKPHIKALFEPLKLLKTDVEKALTDHRQLSDKRKQAAPVLRKVAEGFDYIRQHVLEQKQHQGVVDFDDLITQLHDKVTKDDGRLVSQLRRLYPVAMVDEFQDTDKAQYEILAGLYPSNQEDHVLLMIGDPKQAIYGFRGGDIFTYLTAGKQAQHHWVMDTNWRSVETMVTAYNRLFYGAPLDESASDVFGFGIGYEPVNATPLAKAATSPLIDSDSQRGALTYLLFDSEEEDLSKDTLQQNLCMGLCREIIRLLESANLGQRPVQPADIAILVRSSHEAGMVKQALNDAGLDAVFYSDKGSLFASPQALDVLRVLNGIWHGNDVRKVASALRSPLFGYSHQQLVAMLHNEDDGLWEQTIARLQTLKQMWLKQGVMSMLMHLLQTDYVADDQQPERALTNYLHLSEVLQQTSTGFPQPEQLLLWVMKQIEQPESNDTLVQRLESDAQLIQIITQHGSKGLEYPIVFVPFASDYRDPSKAGQVLDTCCRFYDEQKNQIVLQLGNTERAVDAMRRQGDAEAMRLMYVAVTRAAHRCYLGIAPFKQSERSSVAVALNVGERSWEQAIEQVVEEQPESTALVRIEDIPTVARNRDVSEQDAVLSCRDADISVTNDWRLYSFSALARHTASVHQTARDQEINESASVVLEQSPIQDKFCFSFERGAHAGNLLHDLLEHTDFSDPQWREEGQQALLRFGLDETDYDALFDWLDDVLDTPMSLSEHKNVTLGQLQPSQVLKEAEFYFPMEQMEWGKLANLLQQHRRDLAELVTPLSVPWLDHGQLKGMMHGFIDLLFEVEGKFYVADYKSTHLGDGYGDYLPAELARNNQMHLYDLQYLIYALALHRYLNNNLPEYDPSTHFGGVVYLYLRGMSSGNSNSEGVYYTSITPALLDELDTLFAGEETTS